jgi:hypothetical protein
MKKNEDGLLTGWELEQGRGELEIIRKYHLHVRNCQRTSLIFLNCFIYLHFKCCPPSQHPLQEFLNPFLLPYTSERVFPCPPIPLPHSLTPTSLFPRFPFLEHQVSTGLGTSFSKKIIFRNFKLKTFLKKFIIKIKCGISQDFLFLDLVG